jgi:hypothetical protein
LTHHFGTAPSALARLLAFDAETLAHLGPETHSSAADTDPGRPRHVAGADDARLADDPAITKI